MSDDLDSLSRQVATLILRLRPTAREAHLNISWYDFGGHIRPDTWHVDLYQPDGDGLDAQVMAVLARMQPGAWMNASEIEAALEIEETPNRKLRGLLSEMAKAGVIFSDPRRKLGYRLPLPGDDSHRRR